MVRGVMDKFWEVSQTKKFWTGYLTSIIVIFGLITSFIDEAFFYPIAAQLIAMGEIAMGMVFSLFFRAIFSLGLVKTTTYGWGGNSELVINLMPIWLIIFLIVIHFSILKVQKKALFWKQIILFWILYFAISGASCSLQIIS